MPERNLEYHYLVSQGMTKSDARAKSGYSPNSRPRINKKLLEAFERNNITETRFAQKVDEGLDAKNHFGVPDYQAQIKYLQLISRIKGYERPIEINLSMGLNQFNIVSDPARVEQVLSLIENEIKSREASPQGNVVLDAEAESDSEEIDDTVLGPNEHQGQQIPG